MNLKDVSIGTARIHGLNKEMCCYRSGLGYVWDIYFLDAKPTQICPLTDIILDYEYELEAKKVLNRIKKEFERLGINDGDEVLVLLEKDKEKNKVVAIGRREQFLWIDTTSFYAKSFGKLNITLTGLIVY